MLAPRISWGGCRAGAGRKPSTRPPVPHGSRSDVTHRQPRRLPPRAVHVDGQPCAHAGRGHGCRRPCRRYEGHRLAFGASREPNLWPSWCGARPALPPPDSPYAAGGQASVAYVLLNARRHARRLGRSVAIDPGSSGRWFTGWRRVLVRGETGPPPAVASPRTWLLRTGWRRHGLDPDET